ncbi:MAG: hypothetical protein ACD_4C00354G0001 [uncultured bacterium (gcode 4)]|uniref:Fido domain-containing protein n=1 Tax=uncultured bacterium (gcode 4) TaxID=1234023 RepID=K2GSH3_9BACT|nr:MAG: hypothetical protein ACD_4C00354G0001 [uncultured bacterium (gcode 4)]
MEINYLNIEEVIFIHNEILRLSWWLEWTKNLWQLESVLEHIKNNIYYKDFFEKAGHLFFWIIKFHCFNDWNKRTAIITLDQFFKINWIIIEDFWIKMEDIAIWVAENEISKIELQKIFKSMLLSFWYKLT